MQLMFPEPVDTLRGVEATREIGGKAARDVLLPVLALLTGPALGALPAGIRPPQPASAIAPARIGQVLRILRCFIP